MDLAGLFRECWTFGLRIRGLSQKGKGYERAKQAMGSQECLGNRDVSSVDQFGKGSLTGQGSPEVDGIVRSAVRRGEPGFRCLGQRRLRPSARRSRNRPPTLRRKFRSPVAVSPLA